LTPDFTAALDKGAKINSIGRTLENQVSISGAVEHLLSGNATTRSTNVFNNHVFDRIVYPKRC
jgi:hypothetical protein